MTPSLLRQVVLRCEIGSAANRETVAWLPVELAQVGNVLALRHESQCWKVTRVYKVTVPEQYLLDFQGSVLERWKPRSPQSWPPVLPRP